MKFILPSLFLLVHSVHGQEVYNFSKLDQIVNLTSDQRSVIFYPYESKGKARERKVLVNGIEYHFLITKSSEGQRQEIVDNTNTTLATTWLDGKNKDVVGLPDSSTYSMMQPNKETWVYRKDGQEVVKGSYQKLSGKKSMIIVMDPGLENKLALQLICLERGTDFITHKSATGTFIIVAIVLAVLRVAASGS